MKNDSRFSVHFNKSSCILRIEDIQEIDAGIYQCQIYLTIQDKVTASTEVMIRRPAMIFNNFTQSLVVTEGESIQMECYSDGNPTPTISWHRENNAILPTGIRG